MAAETVTIRILSAGAPKTGVSRCTEAFERTTRNKSDITFNTAPKVQKMVNAGEDAFDIVVAPVAMVEAFESTGRTVAGTRVVVGSVKAAVVVRAEAPAPDISTTDGLRQTILAADAVVYNTASSGLYIEHMLERLEVMDAIRHRIVRVPNGAAVMQHLANNAAAGAIGFGQATEIRLQAERHGQVKLVGALPKEVENVTTYAVAVLSTTTSPDVANELAAFMGSPEGLAIFAATGVAS
jgi:molybdate transport system substrate-binding protein